jgi:hypothetical protein
MDISDLIPGKPGWTWHLDYSGRLKYVLINGDEEFLEIMLDGLAEFGWPIDRYAKSFRKANDGQLYDWFLRVPKAPHGYPGEDDVAIIVMRGVLTNHLMQSDDESAEAAKTLAEVRQRILLYSSKQQQVVAQMEETQQKLEAQKSEQSSVVKSRDLIIKNQAAEMRALDVQLTRATRTGEAHESAIENMEARGTELSQELLRAVDAYKKLLNENTELRYKLQEGEEEGQSNSSDIEERFGELAEARTRADVQAEEALALHQESLLDKNIAEERVLALEAELNARKSDLDAAQLLLDEYASDSRLPEASTLSTSPSGLDDFQQKTEAVLLSLAPRVNFARDSLACLFSFIPNWAPVIDAVKSLQSGDSLTKAKRFNVGPGWYEIHFRTGRANDGRLYYRKRGGEDKVDVLVSIKRRQERDKNYLQGL